jgi:hypothetical protein
MNFAARRQTVREVYRHISSAANAAGRPLGSKSRLLQRRSVAPTRSVALIWQPALMGIVAITLTP